MLGALADIQPLIDATDKQGRTPIMIAVESGDYHLVNAFLELGANEWCRNAQDRTLLHTSVARGHYSLIDLFLKRNHDAAHIDANGSCTLAHSAAARRFNSKIFLQLYELNPHQLCLPNSVGENPWDILFESHFEKFQQAERRGHQELGKALDALVEKIDDKLASDLFDRLTNVAAQVLREERASKIKISSLLVKLAGRPFAVRNEGHLARHISALLGDSTAPAPQQECDDVVCALIAKLSEPTLRSTRIGH